MGPVWSTLESCVLDRMRKRVGHISEICIRQWIFFTRITALIVPNAPKCFAFRYIAQHTSRWRLFDKASEFVSKSLACRCYSKIALPSAVSTPL